MRNKKLKLSMLKRWVCRDEQGTNRMKIAYETYAEECKRMRQENIE